MGYQACPDIPQLYNSNVSSIFSTHVLAGLIASEQCKTSLVASITKPADVILWELHVLV